MSDGRDSSLITHHSSLNHSSLITHHSSLGTLHSSLPLLGPVALFGCLGPPPHRARIVLFLHRGAPPLRLHPLEDAAVMPGRDPAVAAALRAAAAEGDVLPAVGADDH